MVIQAVVVQVQKMCYYSHRGRHMHAAKCASEEGRCSSGCWALLDEATAAATRQPLLPDVVHFWLLRK